MVVHNGLLNIRMKEVILNYSSLANIAGFNRSTFTNMKQGNHKPAYDVMSCIVYMIKLFLIDIAEIFLSSTRLSETAVEAGNLNENSRRKAGYQTIPSYANNIGELSNIMKHNDKHWIDFYRMRLSWE